MKLFNIDLKCQRNTAEFDSAKKLTELDCEVQKFVDKCRAKRIEENEIATAISSAVKKARRKQRTQQWIKFAIGFLVVAVLTQNDISWRYFCRFGREAIFKVASILDWQYSRLYNEPCLLANSFHKPKPVTAADCYRCEDIIAVERISNSEEIDDLGHFIRNQIPVVVSEEFGQEFATWPLHNATVDTIAELFEEKNLVNHICMLRTSFANSDRFWQKARSSKSWFAHWENCGKSATKLVRRQYRRPSFMPPMVELSRSNWLLMSANYKAMSFKLIDIASDSEVVVLTQLKGSNAVRLQPRLQCHKFGCVEVGEMLKESETLIYSSQLWSLWYKPTYDNFSLALIVGGFHH